MKLTEKQEKQLNERIRLNMDIQETELFGVQENSRMKLRREGRRAALLGAAMLLLYVLAVLFTNDVTVNTFGLSRVFEQLRQRTNDIVDLILGNTLSTGIHFFITQFTAPLLVGMALAASGACYQGLFHNPMASPTTLGITSGGMVGAAVYQLFFSNLSAATLVVNSYAGLSVAAAEMSILDRYVQQFFVMAGCSIVVLFVMLLAKIAGKGKIDTVALLLGGTVFTTTINSILSLALYIMTLTGYSSTLTDSIRGMLAGQFGSISSPTTLLVMSIPIVIPLIILLCMSNRLNVIAFGEEEATAMGVNVGRERLIMIILTTIITGTTVAFCGQISFVGLMVPQFARFVVGTDYKYLLPASTFLGGVIMLLAYVLYYTLGFAFSVGTYVNAVGSVVFLIFMIHYRRKGHADWT
ncbi:MAG: iron ABC transporter permease [Oscillospiraceae bacterium]|nr:iron ABC transporter permease [Oscillospiraceae bacterium]